jgi:Activator of Hsp90 ATPase homolog 1-like protein
MINAHLPRLEGSTTSSPRNDDVWSALTDPSRLARWYGEVEGDLRLGGEYRARLFASGWEGTGRVEVCEPPQQLLVRIKDADEPDENVIEVTLTADGDQTTVVWEERGMPVDLLSAYGPECSSMSKISPTTSPGASAAATPRRDGTRSTLPIKAWRPTSADKHQWRQSRLGERPLTRLDGGGPGQEVRQSPLSGPWRNKSTQGAALPDAT